MKIILMNAREDEQSAIAKFKELNPNVTLDVYSNALTKDTMHMLEGYDALVVSQIQPMEKEVYEKMKSVGIKVMATRSAGFDMYDLNLLKENGVRLCRVPVYSPNAIAEFALTSALYLSRNLYKIQDFVNEYDFRWQKPILSTEMRCKTVGILGTGNIGREAARLFKGTGAKIIGYDKYRTELAEQYLEYVDSFEELIQKSDVVSIHMPATQDNYHLFNKETLKMMKPNAIIINTARGSIINTKDLIEALENNVIAGAALDTYEYEAPFMGKLKSENEIDDEIFKKLLKMSNVLYTPHIAFYTETAIENLVSIAIEGAIKILNNEQCDTEVQL